MNSRKTLLATFLATLLMGVVRTAPAASEGEGLPEILPVSVRTQHGPQRPAEVPVLPGLNVGRNPFGGLVGRPAEGQGYQPVDGDSYACHNGRGVHNHIITSGAWWLRTGDRPRLHIELRTGSGAYAQPGLLPDLGVRGQLRIAVTAGERTRWLDEFDSIDTVLSPGSARWTCSDKTLGVTVRLQAHPLIDVFGFAATADVTAAEARDVTLRWVFSKVDSAQIKKDYAELACAGLKYTRIYVGCQSGPAEPAKKDKEGLEIAAKLAAKPDAPARSRLVCVWGYRDYNRQGVADAYRRLRFRPFADPAWLEEMKKKWFDHWIGRGLEPEKKFLEVRAHADEAIARSVEFWQKQRGRLRIKTPDGRFDNVVNYTAAQARAQFEYPAFIHGLTYAKYGKINHGYYGFEAAGMHDEVADSLRFVSGTQDVKGRQRYFMTTFAISDWHEDMDFYFAEQCWWHWRWTGDGRFLETLWPSARRALEHGLATADPDGDGLMTGYYEMWNSDQCNFGGHSALQTALAWSALRGAAEMAEVLDDRDYPPRGGNSAPPVFADRYRGLRDRVRGQYEGRLWQKDVGAWSSAEPNGIPRPRPHTCEQNYAIWRGIGRPMQNYMAMRYVRENLHRSDLVPGSTFEFINDWWPIQWSHHYVASGDTCASFHSACAAGDVDGHWPAFKTVAESAYLNSGVIWHHVGSQSMETDPLFLQAVVDGLLGIQPWFGRNLLVLRPSPPGGWDRVDVDHVDVGYKYRKGAGGVSLEVTTPVPRAVRAELPVRGEIAAVTVGGKPAEHRLKPAVNCCRVVVESPEGREHRFEVKLAGKAPAVEGKLLAILDRKATFAVRGAAVAKVHDPQGAIRDVKIVPREKSGAQVSFVPVRGGKPTVFFELQSGDATWLHPLDLDVRRPWSVVRRYIPPLNKGGPAVASPSIDLAEKTLTVEIDNPTGAELAGPLRVSMAGKTFESTVKIAPSTAGAVRLPLAEVWDRLSPGTVPFRVELAGRVGTSDAVNWSIGKEGGPPATRLRRLDLRPHYNIDMATLFSNQTRWRIDYTGAQHGVDWRRPMPPTDQRGYVLMNSVMSIFEYGNLPEQWISTKRARLRPLPAEYDPGVGIPFLLADRPKAGGGTWETARAQGHLSTWQRRDGAAVMAIEGGAGTSNGYAYGPLDVATDQYRLLRVKLSGTGNARYFIQLSGPGVPTVFRSEWLEPPAHPEERAFELPPGKKIDQLILYTWTEDGRRAENRFESVAFEGGDKRLEVNLEELRAERVKNILALSCTEPCEQFPSHAALALDRPRRLEKVYLLTANLVKTLKCYYPAAEVVVRYADGSEQLHQMIPPYTMPSLVSNICPRAHAVPVGTLEGGGNPVSDRGCYLSVTDLVLDPSKPVVAIELRSVTTESLLGLVGATVLEAPR